MNAAYRSAYELSHLSCADNSARCLSSMVHTSDKHSLKTGDTLYFSGVLGADAALLNCGVRAHEADAVGSKGPCEKAFVVAVAGDYNFTTTPPIDTLTNTPVLDVSSATVYKQATYTAANPNPAAGEHDWSYEDGDKIYIFVSFSEPVVVRGQPRLKLHTGGHHEAGSQDAYATFIGGGYGEKKAFWKNNEPSPVKRLKEFNSYFQDSYTLNSNGCRLKTGATTSCAAYSGISKTVNAKVTLSTQHTLQPGDLVILEGVTGVDAISLNKQHTVGQVACTQDATGATCSAFNTFTFQPAIDMTGTNFDASLARVGRVNLGHRCRARAGADGAAWGPDSCVFSTLASYQLGDALGSQTGINHSAKAAKFGDRADASGTMPTLRREVQFEEHRVEQSMDHTLAFEYTVSSGQQYTFVQNFPYHRFSGEQDHLTASLDYKDVNSLELMGGTVKRACPHVFQIKNVTLPVTNPVTFEVYGKHDLVQGDRVSIEGLGGADARHFEGVFTVQAIKASHGTSKNRVNWRDRWNASPPSGASFSFFQVDLTLDTSKNWIVQAPVATAIARKKTFTANDNYRCPFLDANTKLPAPGDKFRFPEKRSGYFQSLSHNKRLVVGRPYVTHVTADVPNGVYGYNSGVNGRNTVPDVIDVKVHYSEPVVASCGADNCDCGSVGCPCTVEDLDDFGRSSKGWTAPEQYPGLKFRVCTDIKLLLRTKSNSTEVYSQVGHPNYNSTSGEPGQELFPTAFLHENGYDPGHVLSFRYVPRRLDQTDHLQYIDTNALEVHAYSSIRRKVDNKKAGVKLPPTRFDGVNGVTHPRSLAGMTRIEINAVF